MVGKTKTITRAHKERFGKLQDLGCICCLNERSGYRAPDIHHITLTGRRLGHDYTIPLCPYHHRGVIGSHEVFRGPSLADGKKPFVDYFGTEQELLEQVNKLIGEAL